MGTLLPTLCNPVGANGTPLVNRGDIYGQIEIHDTKHEERFTIIKNLCYDVILGIKFLQKIGFKLLNDDHIEISGKPVNRVIDEGRVHCIQTSIICPPANAKILCITQRRECDGKSEADLKKGTKRLAGRDRKQTKYPESTCQPDSTSYTEHEAEQDRYNQTRVQPYLFIATVDGTRSSRNDDLTRRILKIEDETKINHPLERQLVPKIETDASPTNAIESHIDIIKGKLEMPSLAPRVQERLERLITEYQSVFASSDDDIGKFTATDGGPSTVSFHLKDKSKI